MTTNEKNSQTTPQEQPSISQRFTNLVMKEYSHNVGALDTTAFQKNLIQGYFIACDNVLATSEAKRIKDGKTTVVPYTWANVEVNSKLAQNLVVYAKLGLDMTVSNHLFAIPRLNGKTNKYEFTFQEGYKGKEIKAKKYSLYEIKDISAELVYSNDKFIPHKKDLKNPYDTYEFEIQNAFNRGDLVGGFVYIEFTDSSRNALFIMSKADIEKRKAVAQSQTFWTKWYEEMALKTVISAGCSKKVSIDPQKIDDDYRQMQLIEREAAEQNLEKEINLNANTIDVEIEAPVQAIAEKTTVADLVVSPIAMDVPEVENAIPDIESLKF